MEFNISPAQKETVSKWADPQSGHECTAELTVSRNGQVSKKVGAIGGEITYMFTPTSIGTIVKVQCCGICGAELDLTEYSYF